MQARLLRVLEAGEVRRLGENQARPIDVRVVGASHQDLRAAVAAGRFRADLLFRLGVARVEVPPLRARPRDLAVLGSTLAAAACARMGRRPMTVGASAAWELARRSWPGNVRELRHTLEAAIATAPDDVRELAARHLPPAESSPVAAVAAPPVEAPSSVTAPSSAVAPSSVASAPSSAAPFRPIADELAALERARMVEALRVASGVQVRAAELLAMPIRTFATKLRRYAIEPEDWGAP
jgi:two-component system response regulator AtoC